MKPAIKWLSILLTFLLSICYSSPLYSQNVLNEVSLTPRSDGKGYVTRFHLNQSVDSARVVQARPDLVQLLLFDDNISKDEDFSYTFSEPITDVTITELPLGMGIDINLTDQVYVTPTVYPDVNERDWLLALNNTDQETVEILTDGIEPVDWEQYKPVEIEVNYTDSTLVEEKLVAEETNTEYSSLEDEGDDAYTSMKNKVKFDTIVLDAGHGGHDPGTIGYSRTKEKKIALAVMLKLGEYLEKNLPELNVVYTRKDDRFIELEERGHIANRAGGDLFVSIHCNAVGNQYVQGTEVFFLGQHKSEEAYEIMKKENTVVKMDDTRETEELSEQQLLIYDLTNSGYMATSQRLASMIDEQFRERAQRRSRGVKQAGFVVLYYASMPSILIELGFITNRNDERFLNSEYGQAIMASAIFRAIRDYYELVNK